MAMVSRVRLGAAVSAITLSCCGGTSEPGGSADGSVDVMTDGADAASLPDQGADRTEPSDRCPADEPQNGYDCFLTNAIGRVCAYGSATCVCVNGGQNSAQWTCTGGDAGAGEDGDAAMSPLDCTFGDASSAFDASSRFQGSCVAGCPAGTICAVQIGGVAGGGGEYCAPIPDRCKGTPTCACLASCVCGSRYGQPEACTDSTNPDGGKEIDCDDGIR